MHSMNTRNVTLFAANRRATQRWSATAAAAITMGCVPLILAAPAAAKNLDKHVAQDCPAPISQACAPRVRWTVDMAKATTSATVSFTADPNPPACAPALITMWADGQQLAPAQLIQPGQTTDGHVVPILTPGNHVFEVQATGALGGCNTGAMSGWSGTIHVSTSQQPPPGAPPVTTTTPQAPPPGQPGDNSAPQPSGHTMTWTATGSGPTVNINLDGSKQIQTADGPNLPWSHSETILAKPGDLYQIVVTAKGDAPAGCTITYDGHVVASQPLASNSEPHCIWNVPPN
jgi:hypothetical protein